MNPPVLRFGRQGLAAALSLVLGSCGAGGGANAPAPAAHPRQVVRLAPAGVLDTAGYATAVLKDADILYVADRAGGLVLARVLGDGSMSRVSGLPLAPGEECFSLAKRADRLYLACRSGGLQVVDVSAPEAPRVVAKVPTPSLATGLSLVGDRLYVADKADFLVYDLGVPDAPSLLAKAETVSQGSVVEGGVAYVAGQYTGFSILDVSRPGQVSTLSTTYVGFPVYAVARWKDSLLVAGQGNALLVYDVRNAAEPVLTASLALWTTSPAPADDQAVTSIKVGEGHAYLASAHEGVQVVALEEQGGLRVASCLPTSATSRDVVLDGSTIYVADGQDGVRAGAVSILADRDGDGLPDGEDVLPDDPREWLDADRDGQGNNADLDDDDDGVLDTTDAFPLDPAEWKDSDGDGRGDNADEFSTDPAEWQDTDHDGVGNQADPDDDGDNIPDALDEDPLVPRQPVSVATSSAFAGIAAGPSAAAGGRLVVVDGPQRLVVLERGEGGLLAPSSALDLGESVGVAALAGSGDLLFAGTTSGEVLGFRLSSSGQLEQAGALSLPGGVRKLLVRGGRLFALTVDVLSASDVSLQGALTEVGRVEAADAVDADVDAAGRTAYLATQAGHLLQVDATGPDLRVANDRALGFTVGAIALKEDYVVGVRDGARLFALDTNAFGEGPVVAGYYSLVGGDRGTPAGAWQIALAGDYAFVLKGDGKVEVVDVFRPYQPLPYGVITSPAASSASAGGEELFLSCGADGLRAVSLAGLPEPQFRGKWTITRITDTPCYNDVPRIDGADIVWRGDDQKKIYFGDGRTGAVRDLTEGLTGLFAGEPALSNGQVAWRAWDRADKCFLYFWDGRERRVLREYPTGPFEPQTGYPPSFHSLEVSLDRGRIVWPEWDGTDYEIMLWDGGTIRALTDNQVDDYEPQIAAGRVSWTTAASPENGTINVMFWDGQTTRNLSQSRLKAEDSNLDDSTAAWVDWSPGTVTPNVLQFDVNYWDGRDTYVVEVEGSDFEPAVSRDRIAWLHKIGDRQYDVEVWDGRHAFNVTRDPARENTEVAISGNRMVFRARDAEGPVPNFEIYLATFTSEGDLSALVVGARLGKKAN